MKSDSDTHDCMRSEVSKFFLQPHDQQRGMSLFRTRFELLALRLSWLFTASPTPVGFASVDTRAETKHSIHMPVYACTKTCNCSSVQWWEVGPRGAVAHGHKFSLGRFEHGKPWSRGRPDESWNPTGGTPGRCVISATTRMAMKVAMCDHWPFTATRCSPMTKESVCCPARQLRCCSHT